VLRQSVHLYNNIQINPIHQLVCFMPIASGNLPIQHFPLLTTVEFVGFDSYIGRFPVTRGPCCGIPICRNVVRLVIDNVIPNMQLKSLRKPF
jgi:hypothetical protein